MDTEAIIERLGGTGKTAAVCGVTAAAVTLWKRSGIPPAHWLAIATYAQDAGIPGVTFDAIQSARHAARNASAA